MTDSSGFGDMIESLIAEARNPKNLQIDESIDEAAEVEGKAYEDHIIVKMRAGKVTRIDLDSWSMDLDKETLGEELTKAVNSAIDANLEAVMNSEMGLDYQQLTKNLQEVQQESIRQLDKYAEGMLSMLRSVKDMQ